MSEFTGERRGTEHVFPIATRGGLLVASLAVALGLALWLAAMGRPLLCTCGTVRLWAGDPSSPMSSQQVSDWYSALHVVFGLALFLFLDGVRAYWRTSQKLVVAIAASAVWEAIENIPFVIALFGNAPGAPAYAGDSILNAVSDTGFVAAGFLLAGALPLPAILALAVAIEIGVSFVIDDGLVLGSARLLGVPV